MTTAKLLLVLCAGMSLAACGRPSPSTRQPSGAASTGPTAAEPLMSRAEQIFKVVPAGAPTLAGNAATPAKVELGKMLFFDPRLSASHTISCASCHNLSLGGADAEPTSIGHQWQHGGRNAPTVLNAVFDTAQFWDGRAADLEHQAGGPIVNPVEMASPSEHVAEQLKGIPGYRDAFARAFPGEPDPISLANVQKSIAVFEATLTTPDSPFDRYLGGHPDALTPGQKAGLALFIDKGCSSCHNGVGVGGGMYAPFGVAAKPGAELLPPGDKGRFAVTHSPGDQYVFKVPSLRNVALTAPYFHTGAVWDLRQAVGVMGTSQLGAQLSPDEVDKITDFLGSLTGSQPKVTLPVLPASGATTPRPQP